LLQETSEYGSSGKVFADLRVLLQVEGEVEEGLAAWYRDGEQSKMFGPPSPEAFSCSCKMVF